MHSADVPESFLSLSHRPPSLRLVRCTHFAQVEEIHHWLGCEQVVVLRVDDLDILGGPLAKADVNAGLRR